MTLTTVAPTPTTTSTEGGMLEIRGLVTFFGRHEVLRNIDLHVESGTAMSVVGPSGCGKTTLLRVIAGFERPDAGTVSLNGRILSGPKVYVPAHRRGIGYVPQDGALFPHLSIAGNVGFGLSRRERTPDRIVELLERVSLPAGLAERRPDQLSGGQQQRVAVARALAQSPSTILLDEPFSALDAGLRTEIRDSMGAVLKESGVTCILVTHDHEEALSFASRVALLRAGTLVQSGSPRELYCHPVDDAAGEFFGEVVRLPGAYDSSTRIVETACGPVSLSTTTTHPGDGERVTVAVRPEQVALTPVDLNHSHPGRGQVTAVRFLGSAVRCEVEVPKLGPLAVRTRSQDAPREGDIVRLSIAGEGWLADSNYVKR